MDWFEVILRGVGLAREREERSTPSTPTCELSGNVIFLDIDGVLHPGQSETFVNLPLLETFLRSFTQVSVVISSDWRLSHTLEQLKRYFSDDLKERVVGVTPELMTGGRVGEIEAFCREHGISNWVAVDDRLDLFPRHRDRLILTRGDTGITELEIALLERWMS